MQKSFTFSFFTLLYKDQLWCEFFLIQISMIFLSILFINKVLNPNKEMMVVLCPMIFFSYVCIYISYTVPINPQVNYLALSKPAKIIHANSKFCSENNSYI